MGDSIQRITVRTGDQAWLVTGHETVRGLLTDPRLDRTHPQPESAPRFSRSASFDQPRAASETARDDHRRIRRTLLRSLSASRVARIRPQVASLAADLLDELARGGAPGDFHAVVAAPLPAMVICELLGIPDEHRERLCLLSTVAAERDGRGRARTAYAALCRYLAPLAAQRREQPRDDVLSELATAHPQQSAGLAAELFLAGHLTTSAAIDKALVVLLTGGIRLGDLRDAEEFAAAVEELVRMPFPGVAADAGRALPRYATVELTIGGERVEAGDLVLLSVDGANLDDRVFGADASEVDLGRHPNPHLGFGHGPYSCVGATLARMEMAVLFELLAARFPKLELAVPVERLRLRSDLITGGLRELPVSW